MRRMLPTLCLLVACALPAPARAGAWMREPGAAFLSFGIDWQEAGPGQTLFLEFGATPTLTLGLDGWQSAFGDWQILATAQRPLGGTEGDARFALSLGAGVGSSGGAGAAVLRVGAHAGRGLERGWLASDLTGTWSGTTGALEAKATATWGRVLTDRCSAIVEARAETSVGAALAPSVVCGLGDSLRLRIGGSWPVTGTAEPTVGAQTWLEF